MLLQGGAGTVEVVNHVKDAVNPQVYFCEGAGWLCICSRPSGTEKRDVGVQTWKDSSR